MAQTSLLLGLALVAATAHALVVGANGVCPSASQPTHSYGAPAVLGASSHGLRESATGGSATVQDTNVADCNGDSVPNDFDGDYDYGVGGAFFGDSSVWDGSDNCGYDLNVHATTGTASSPTTSGTFGVDDAEGPVVITDPHTGATVSCQSDGSITPDTDANDCLSAWTGSWSPGSCYYSVGADDGYWLFLAPQSGLGFASGTLTADF